MNCDHLDDGWCLKCVSELHDKFDREITSLTTERDRLIRQLAASCEDARAEHMECPVARALDDEHHAMMNKPRIQQSLPSEYLKALAVRAAAVEAYAERIRNAVKWQCRHGVNFRYACPECANDDEPDECRDLAVKLATARGWKFHDGYWIDPQGDEWQVMHGWQTYKDGSDILPDFCFDLNAMRDFEQWLWEQDWSLREVFVDHLARILHPLHGYRRQSGEDLLDAAAVDRAKAAALTVDNWQLMKKAVT
jgi:hypothetical protein